MDTSIELGLLEATVARQDLQRGLPQVHDPLEIVRELAAVVEDLLSIVLTSSLRWPLQVAPSRRAEQQNRGQRG